MCYATRSSNATLKEMERRYRIVCVGEEAKKSELEIAAEVALSVMQDAQGSFSEQLELFVIMNAALIALIAFAAVISTVIRPLRLVLNVLTRVQPRIAAHLSKITARKAANDEAIILLQEALRKAA